MRYTTARQLVSSMGPWDGSIVIVNERPAMAGEVVIHAMHSATAAGERRLRIDRMFDDGFLSRRALDPLTSGHGYSMVMVTVWHR